MSEIYFFDNEVKIYLYIHVLTNVRYHDSETKHDNDTAFVYIYIHTHARTCAQKYTYTDVPKLNLTPGVSEIAYYDTIILCQKINIALMGDYQSITIHSQSKFAN